MKKAFDYFDTLNRQGDIALQAPRALQCDLFALPAAQEKLHALARESETLRQQLALALLEDFLPPLGREDLLRVSRALAEIPRQFAAQAGGWDLHAAAGRQKRCEALCGGLELLRDVKKNARALLALAARQFAHEPDAPLDRLAACLEESAVKNM